ncbi:CDP-glycerol glycerophosphotransferase family protein [Ectobacillus funiculus]|uniref:CDP-glycerol glycerophosphotransferase family protein n=1 Tax=Ectobacillus funiculus TaxID=137993 RepID=UPI0013ED7A2E|nr:CDP-glycerol glycerophosphotransferase family protein [Ectobacillus funiculus]
MLREVIIISYLFLFQLLFMTFRIFPLRNKASFIMSYGENHFYIYEEMKKQNVDCEVVFLYKSTFKYELDHYHNVKAYKFETLNILHMIKSVYHIATSRYVMIDNYFGFLSTVNFRAGVTCVQLWHAAGAIKQFGLLTPSSQKRSRRAQQRFVRVYKNFHKVVIGSDALANVYIGAFGIAPEQMLRTGIPRTDLFFNQTQIEEISSGILKDNPGIIGKKVILYTPTFRDKELAEFSLQLDIEKMYQELKDEYVLFIKLHPAIRNQIDLKDMYAEFVYDYSFYPNVNDLFLVTDILVTDYSSTSFEFSLLKKPMIFFPYDLERYREKRGIIEDYHSLVPGPVVYTTKDLIQMIQKGSFDPERIEAFCEKWNQYSRGASSKNIVEALFHTRNS